MTSHDLSEDSFDWKALDAACQFFSKNLRRWGRISVSGCKEKYGTLRLEHFNWGAHYNEFFHSLIKPGYIYVTWPVWFRELDWKIAAIASKIGISNLIYKYQRLIFNLVTVRAVKKWPHIQAEMLNELEFQELLYKPVKQYIGFKDHWIVYSTKQETTEL